MKLALIGYGKMGHAVEKIALERGHEIVAVVDAGDEDILAGPEFASADAAIEFTTPQAAPGNVMKAVAAGVPVVCGSTGWNDRRAEVEDAVKASGSAMIASSNFSIGVNVMMEISRRLARIMDRFPQYTPSLSETHHIHKLDHPSGTAITLLEGIIKECGRENGWQEGAQTGEGVIAVECERRGEVPGLHTVSWTSAVDRISLTHEAFSRNGFALGAVMAAEWIVGRHGVFGMNDMLDWN